MFCSVAQLSTLALLAATSFAQIDVGRIAANAHCDSPQLVNNATIAVGDKLVLFTSLLCATPASANATPSKRNEEVATVEKRDLWKRWPLCLLFHTCPRAYYPPYPPPKPTTTKHTSSTAPATTKSHSSSAPPSSSSIPSSTISSTPTPSPTSPAPVHVCGASCTTVCNNDAGVLPPTSDDCQTIEQAIEIFKNQGPTSFVVDPLHVETLSFGTCSYFFINLSDHQLEYCWVDLSSTAHSAGGACFPPNQPFTSEGLCTSADGQWAVGAAHA